MSDFGLNEEYPLSSEQITSFFEDGWAPLPNLLNRAVVDEMRTLLRDAEVGRRAVETDSTYGMETRSEYENRFVNHGELASKFPLFHQVATSRRLGGVAVRLMKLPEALFSHDLTFVKAPGGGATPFHQDLPFFPFDRKGSLSLWIALVDLEEEMGPLRYVKRSHLEGPLGRFLGVDIRETYPDLFASPVVAGNAMRAGDAQIHWDLTIHGAAANTAEKAREAYVVRYMRPDTIYTGTGHPHFDPLGLPLGSTFGESAAFPRVGENGLIS